MAITSITRDFAENPSIVRIVTTDDIATASTTGYILAQDANIQALNNGEFTWQLTDMTLVSASDGFFFANISTDFQSLIPLVFTTTVVGTPVVVGDIASFASTGGNIEDSGFSVLNGLLAQPAATGLTAHSGGGQTSALLLTKVVNNVTTVAAAGDSVALPTAAAGLEITVTNSGANSMQVYGSGTDTINGITYTVGVPQLPGVTVVYTAATTGNWLANVVSNPNPNPLLFASVPITAAQFNGMYASPFELVATPGDNMMLAVDTIELIMTYGSADFAAGGVVAAQYGSSVHGAGTAATNTEAAADFFAAASTVFQFKGVSGNTVGAIPVANAANAALYLSNATAPFTTGDSTFIAKVYYRVVSLTGAL